MDILQAIITGIVQGITEFLPVSSNAHIKIVSSLCGWSDPGAAFTAAIQMGTILAVFTYFWKDISTAFMAWVRSFTHKEVRNTSEAKLGWAVVVGTLPISVLGILLKKHIESSFRSLEVIAFSLIFLAVLMFIAERVAKHVKTLEHVKPIHGLIVGLWQCLALVPGMSRSGSTITGALFVGFTRETAARFSFLLSIPAITLAGLYEMQQHVSELFGPLLVPSLVANVLSFVVGYLFISILMRYLQKHSTLVFIVYRICLGIALFIMLKNGIIKA